MTIDAKDLLQLLGLLVTVGGSSLMVVRQFDKVIGEIKASLRVIETSVNGDKNLLLSRLDRLDERVADLEQRLRDLERQP